MAVFVKNSFVKKASQQLTLTFLKIRRRISVRSFGKRNFKRLQKIKQNNRYFNAFKNLSKNRLNFLNFTMLNLPQLNRDRLKHSFKK